MISGYKEREISRASNLIVYQTKTICDSETKRRDLPKISLSFFLSFSLYIYKCICL